MSYLTTSFFVLFSSRAKAKCCRTKSLPRGVDRSTHLNYISSVEYYNRLIGAEDWESLPRQVSRRVMAGRG